METLCYYQYNDEMSVEFVYRVEEEGGCGAVEDLFLASLYIHKIRHLHDINITLSPTERKHLILTGINGTGKTSVLESLQQLLFRSAEIDYPYPPKTVWETIISRPAEISYTLNEDRTGDWSALRNECKKEQFILSFFPSSRTFSSRTPQSVVSLDKIKNNGIREKRSDNFETFLVNLNYQRVNAYADDDTDKYQRLQDWFTRLQAAFRELYSCPELVLKHYSENLRYKIQMPGREEFALNEMAHGYSALIDIMSEIMMRMEFFNNSDYDVQE